MTTPARAPQHRRTPASRTPPAALYAILSHFQTWGRHILRVAHQRRFTVKPACTENPPEPKYRGIVLPQVLGWSWEVLDEHAPHGHQHIAAGHTATRAYAYEQAKKAITRAHNAGGTVTTNGAPPVDPADPQSPRAEDGRANAQQNEDQQ